MYVVQLAQLEGSGDLRTSVNATSPELYGVQLDRNINVLILKGK